MKSLFDKKFMRYPTVFQFTAYQLSENELYAVQKQLINKFANIKAITIDGKSLTIQTDGSLDKAVVKGFLHEVVGLDHFIL